jgi:L-ascorbate metabolism protein UlaG (beta-lactamase superfamily)
MSLPRVTYVGGPTALLEWGGLRLLTDPTFDPAGTVYTAGAYSLRKTRDPARPADALLPLDAVLLSHDHHWDNLDHGGRAMLGRAARALGSAIVVPVHYEGWEHFSESRPEIERAFAAAGLAGRLRWPAPGAPTEIATPTGGDR